MINATGLHSPDDGILRKEDSGFPPLENRRPVCLATNATQSRAVYVKITEPQRRSGGTFQ